MSKFTDRIDMRFPYVPAAATDIRKTWAKERKRLAEDKAKQEAAEKEAQIKVRKIKEAK